MESQRSGHASALAYSRWQVAIGKKSRLPRLLNLFAGRGNVDLEPENNLVMEISANQHFWNGCIEVNLTGFRSDVDNMIVFQSVAGGRTQDQNAVSFISHGIEGNVTTNFTKAISWTLDYTYIDQVFENRGDAIFNDGYYQTNSQIAFRSSWGIGVFLQGSYVNFGTPSKPKISSTVGEDTFVLLNGKISYTFAKNWTPYLAVENIADSNYSRIFGFPQPGRRFFFGLTTNFYISRGILGKD